MSCRDVVNTRLALDSKEAPVGRRSVADQTAVPEAVLGSSNGKVGVMRNNWKTADTARRRPFDSLLIYYVQETAYVSYCSYLASIILCSSSRCQTGTLFRCRLDTDLPSDRLREYSQQ